MYDNNNFDNQGRPYDFYGHVCAEAKKTFSRFFIALFFYFLITYSVIFIAEAVMILSLGSEQTAQLLEGVYFQWIFSTLPTYLIALPALYLIVKNIPTTRFERKPYGIKEFFLTFLVAQALMTLGNSIGITINSFIGAIFQKEITNATSDLIASSPIWLISIVVVVVGPLVEEFIFRKLLMDRLAKYGTVLSIVVSSVAFGLFHGNLYQFFYAALLGALLGYLYARTGNWLYPTAMHMIINLFGSILTLPVVTASEKVTEYMDQWAESEVMPEIADYLGSFITVGAYTIISYAMTIAGAIIFFVVLKNKKFCLENRCEIYIPRERRFSTIVFNVGTILYLIISAIFFTISIFS